MLRERVSNRAAPADIDTAALERDLRAAVAGEVRFDAGSRALYATDASNYRQVPIGVVIPRDGDDVRAVVRVCHSHRAPLLSRGAGTSLCGQCCNVAVVMDFSKYMNRIVDVDPEARTARVQPGVVLDDLRRAANRHGLTFAPDPATHTHNTLGGMIGNNSCGPHSVLGGKTVDNILEMDVLTSDGLQLRVGPTDDDRYRAILAGGGRRAEIYRDLHALARRHGDEIRRRFPQIPRRVSGYNLQALLPEEGFDVARALVGSEGTCVVVLEATVRLVEWPASRTLLVLGYPSVYEAADHVPEVMAARPIALEGIDDRLVADIEATRLTAEHTAALPAGGGWLLVEFGGRDKDESEGQARQLMERLADADAPPDMKLCRDADDAALVWKIRESGLGATAHVPDKPMTWEGWEDSAVPPERLGEYLRALRTLLERYGYGCDLYGHFGQGCVHTRIDFDLETAEGIARYRDFIHEAARLVARFGGSISGEHGDGQSKAELLPVMYGDDIMSAFRSFKDIWDPERRMNPGKLIDAHGATENLRLGPASDPRQPKVHLAYPADRGDFGRTLLRCVGVGACRSRQGVMCPSYMATGEEMHSTRGRAHLLSEMLRGEVLTGGWKEPAVKEGLDLCLSCKGCKGECPVRVDMATYKAEFLSHYYEGRMRPPAAYAFGLIDRWARLASFAPRLANFLSQSGPTASIARRVAGIAGQRSLPRFPPQPFARGFRPQPPGQGERQVVLWPDTFHNYLRPEVADAAARVLKRAGFSVRLPRRPLCCGRPLYEFGMLDRARNYLRRVVATLDEEIRQGIPIVGLEPACVSIFREELPQMLPDDQQAAQLGRQFHLFSEFLDRHAGDADLGHLDRKALVHLHCHHRSVLGSDAEEAVLRRTGLDFKMPDTGCCGMAGAFGMQADKIDVSLRCAERALLPAVRTCSADTLIVANGYSCREQILQTTDRAPLHLAQVLDLSMKER